MRSAVIGGFAAAGLLVALGAAAGPHAPSADRPGEVRRAGDGGLIALNTIVGENQQQLTLVDPQMRVISVYHIELATGEIVLKSVRNFHWDQQMIEFNGTSPLPREIRALLDQK